MAHKVKTLVPTAGNAKASMTQRDEKVFLCLTRHEMMPLPLQIKHDVRPGCLGQVVRLSAHFKTMKV